MQSTDCIQVLIKLWESEAFYIEDQKDTLILGMFFGFLAIMLIYNLFLYLSIQDRSYLSYVVFVGTAIHMQISQKGIGYQYFWPDSPAWNHVNLPFSLFIALAAAFLFVREFLDLNQSTHRWLSFGLSCGIWVNLICSAASFFIPYEKIILVPAYMGPLESFIILYIAIHLWFKGNRSAGFLILAWLAFLSGAVLFALTRLGVLPRMLLTENAMLVGSALEAALISFALADSINQERESRIEAQEKALLNEQMARESKNKALQIQKRANQNLEQKVKERTRELEIAMQKLGKVNIKLNDLAILDGLTGIHNRRYFDEHLESEWNRSQRQQKPLSLLLVDIDHFKKINDTYGHLVGDNCLVSIAAVLKGSLRRSIDTASRYGGEELGIILSSTDEQGACVIAERIRSGVEALLMDHQGQDFRLTISVGVAAVLPEGCTNSKELIAFADQALYHAKENGRNRVESLLLCEACFHRATEATVFSS